eukprot:CAMPEP_0184495070 /NCGR_PEP_ID=MMETSP0113_2-20130426/30292_1 /TAXON_ID=91329 /ORGANISM="Norrisiella sphaerica, Strain BC52" /LENGTH=220 /DNA_ID=CAMNT_0026881099 /DNA_START=89 /DNA_END=748 /DNA_ORIENTATION=-
MVHLAYRDYIDSTGTLVKEYQPERLKGWQAPLVAKIMKLWEFMSATYREQWAHRCSWFVKSDDDTWLNAKLVEQRLGCMDPDIELNFGYSCGFGVGVYTGYSRAVIDNFAYFIQELRKESDPEWFIGDIEDRRIGQVLLRFNITIERAVRVNGTIHPDYLLFHPDTADSRREEWARGMSPIGIGCMSMAHHARPGTMTALTEKLDEHLRMTGGDACPNLW